MPRRFASRTHASKSHSSWRQSRSRSIPSHSSSIGNRHWPYRPWHSDRASWFTTLRKEWIQWLRRPTRTLRVSQTFSYLKLKRKKKTQLLLPTIPTCTVIVTHLVKMVISTSRLIVRRPIKLGQDSMILSFKAMCSRIQAKMNRIMIHIPKTSWGLLAWAIEEPRASIVRLRATQL